MSDSSLYHTINTTLLIDTSVPGSSVDSPIKKYIEYVITTSRNRNVSQLPQETYLSEISNFFVNNMKFDKPITKTFLDQPFFALTSKVGSTAPSYKFSSKTLKFRSNIVDRQKWDLRRKRQGFSVINYYSLPVLLLAGFFSGMI